MALYALLTRQTTVIRTVRDEISPDSQLLVAGARSRLEHYMQNRPVVSVLVDIDALQGGGPPTDSLHALRRGYPRTPIILLASPTTPPAQLFRVGRSGEGHLVMIMRDERAPELRRTLAEASGEGVVGLVTRVLAPYLPARELSVVRNAMATVDRRPGADEFAGEVGLSRPYLSECLKSLNLPSVGHLLIWARLLYAGYWLEEPARSGESVSRQLEYSSGAAFRRALKHYTGATPTEVIEQGGLVFVLRRFLERFSEGKESVATA